MKIDEFLPIFSQCKKDKDHGGFEDFLECLKLYDKQENGMMLGAELSHTLLALGELLAYVCVEKINIIFSFAHFFFIFKQERD